ncbi:RNA-dependent RNA polymerase P1 [Barley yellow dwarf virus-kerII]|nr:RNA-dependent RNA polymerase P1 [Barley yellow dwarf virus-kerII]AGN54059.1 RNA-dependent RNA polymerase P1 [Barley yellow dwarf virus-kerII]
MVFFELLIGASVKAVKDFISHCYSRLKSIYYSLKRWLWELQGKFKAHDAFVNMCYGHMSDIEDFEIPLAGEFEVREGDLEIARAKLALLIAQHSDIGVTEAYGKYASLTGSIPVPEDYKPSVKELGSAADSVESLISEHLQAAREASKIYIKEKGVGFINSFNSLKARFKHVKEQTLLFKHNEEAASKIKQQLFAVENIDELHNFTEVTQEENGLKKTIIKEVNGEEQYFEMPIKVDVRRIKDTPVDREKAATWIRAYIKAKNSSLTADELSFATIPKYIENLAAKHDLSAESRTYLTKCALIMVPLPTSEEIAIKMTVQSPAARSRREQIEILDARGF